MEKKTVEIATILAVYIFIKMFTDVKDIEGIKRSDWRASERIKRGEDYQ